jgi:serine/threonine-protein kinase
MSSSIAAPPPPPHPGESEDGRAFFQARIALFSKVCFALSGFFLVLGNLISLMAQSREIDSVFNQSNAWHLGAALISFLVWLVTRRPQRRLSHGLLVFLDAGGTVLSLTGYALMSGTVPLNVPPEFHITVVPRLDLLMIMVTLLELTVRAMLVPSTVAYTVLVSSSATIPALGLAYFVYEHHAKDIPGVSTVFGMANMVLWAASAVIVAGITARIIYGLRAEVAAAQRLGQYLLDEKIGEGGMGTVYRASHALLRRPTAVKLLPPQRAGAENLSRFEREVQLTSRLTHPNTVAIFDYGHTPEGVFYYVMEYLDGVDLDELVERHGPQPPARVVHLLAQVCGSLAEAHAIGLVHRDIKPANIIVCERGGVPDVAKVVDFGLVKSIGDDGDGNVTRSDAVLGTPYYLAPETIKSDEVDARADLYALGAVGYYLLCGSPVFDGTGVVEICAKHLHEKPKRVSERASQPVPRDLEALIMRCLAKEPADRPESAQALEAALRACSVPEWTHADAAAWWSEHGGSPKRVGGAPRKDTASALTVDVRKRMTDVERVA